MAESSCSFEPVKMFFASATTRVVTTTLAAAAIEKDSAEHERHVTIVSSTDKRGVRVHKALLARAYLCVR